MSILDKCKVKYLNEEPFIEGFDQIHLSAEVDVRMNRWSDGLNELAVYTRASDGTWQLIVSFNNDTGEVEHG